MDNRFIEKWRTKMDLYINFINKHKKLPYYYSKNLTEYHLSVWFDKQRINFEKNQGIFKNNEELESLFKDLNMLMKTKVASSF